MNEQLYQPNPRWHPASRDAYNERIAILMEGPDEPSVAIRRIAWLQAQSEEVIHRKEAELRMVALMERLPHSIQPQEF